MPNNLDSILIKSKLVKYLNVKVRIYFHGWAVNVDFNRVLVIMKKVLETANGYMCQFLLVVADLLLLNIVPICLLS